MAKERCATPLLVIVLAAFALYANTLFHDYALDDIVVIAENTFTQRGVGGIPDILTNEGTVGFFGADQGMLAGGRYRPLSQVFFAIEYELFGLNPFVGHLMNVLYYALLCALVFVVLRRLFDNPIVETGRAPSPYPTLPFVATMVFLVHPLHTEVVANIKGRDEIFAMLGAMGALYFSLNHVTCHRGDGARPVSTGHRITTLAGVFLAFLFGLLSKENTLTFLVVIPLTMYLFLKRRPLSGVEGRFLSGVEGQSYKRIMAMLLAATVVYVVMRYNAVSYWISDPNPVDMSSADPFMHTTAIPRIATALYTLLLYFKLLFVPYPLTHDYYSYHIPILDFSDYRVWLSLVLVALLAYDAMRNFKKNPIVTYGLLFFFITFAMVSNLLINVGSPMNERFMFMPLLGFAIIVGYGVQRWAATPSLQGVKKWVLPIVLIAVGLTLSSLTIHRNRAWKDDLTLYTTDAKVSKRSVIANSTAAELLLRHAVAQPASPERQSALEQALSHLQRTQELLPNHGTARDRLAWCYLYLERYDEALEAFECAIREGQTDRIALVSVTQMLTEKGERAWTKKFYELALEVFTDDIDRLQILVSYHMIDQDYASAERYINEILQHHPDDAWTLSQHYDIQKHRNHNPNYPTR